MNGIIVFLLAFFLVSNTQKDVGTMVLSEIPEGLKLPSYYEEAVNIDLVELKERGKITALITPSPTDYFIYKGQPMGFSYELLQLFSEEMGIEVDIKVVKHQDSLLHMLYRGEGDLIAQFVPVTSFSLEYLGITEHHHISPQVLVQRKPEKWHLMNPVNVEKKLVKEPTELAGKVIHVQENSAFSLRLKNIAAETGEIFQVVEQGGNISSFDLVRQVAEGETDFTVVPEYVANLMAAVYPRLDFRMKMSLPQKQAWAVRKNSPQLQEYMGKWLGQMKRKAIYHVIYNKYYKNTGNFSTRLGSEFMLDRPYPFTKLSTFDETLKEKAKEIGWDWRLLSALIYQESRFHTQLVSSAGAIGLMQVMPATGKRFGATNLYSPEQNIEAGIGFIKYLERYWHKIHDPQERIKFILASYNAGPGHVEDARRLATKYGKSSEIWDGHVAEYIKLKSEREYFTDEVVRHGYCQGAQPYYYVQKIMALYSHYRKFTQGEIYEDIHLKDFIHNPELKLTNLGFSS